MHTRPSFRSTARRDCLDHPHVAVRTGAEQHIGTALQYRSSSGRADWTTVFEGRGTQYTITGLVNGENYCARVKSDSSDWSQVRCATPVGGPTDPEVPPADPPSNVNVVPGDEEIALRWDASNNAFDYRIRHHAVEYASIPPFPSTPRTRATRCAG